MAVNENPRTGLPTYTSGADPHPTRLNFNDRMDLLSLIMALAEQGTSAARPAAGKRGRFYWDTGVKRLYYDDGVAWAEVTTNGGGGAGRTIVVAGAATEGSSDRSARADHTHSLALATSSTDGALPATDKAALNGATSTGTAGQLVRNDGTGRHSVATPAALSDVSNKGYVDQQVATRAATAHSHAANDTTTGVFNPARLPVVTVAEQGAMLAADKTKLDAATNAATGNTLIWRDSTGRAHIADPTFATHIANKGYVDLQASSITWAGINNKPATFAPAAHTHPWGDVTGKPADYPSTWNLVGGKPGTFPPTSHKHSSLDGPGGISLDVGTDRAGDYLHAPFVNDRTYNTEPNMYVTSMGTIGRGTISMARANHNHSGGDITSGNVPNARIQGSADAWNRGPGSTYNTVVMRPDGTFCEFPSAAKFKQDIVEHPIDPARFYELEASTVEFAYRQDPDTRHFGTIADRWAETLPELVGTEEDNETVRSFHYEKVGVALIPTIQDLNTRLKTVEADNVALRKELAAGKKARAVFEKRTNDRLTKLEAP